jgi:hypothetical protein
MINYIYHLPAATGDTEYLQWSTFTVDSVKALFEEVLMLGNLIINNDISQQPWRYEVSPGNMMKSIAT